MAWNQGLYTWSQPKAVYILCNSFKLRNCYISLQALYRNDQIIAELWKAKLEMYCPGELQLDSPLCSTSGMWRLPHSTRLTQAKNLEQCLLLAVIYSIRDKLVLCNANQTEVTGTWDWAEAQFLYFQLADFLESLVDWWLTTDSVAPFWWETRIYPPKGRSCHFVEGAEKWFCMDQIAVIIIRHITIYTEVCQLVTADCQM